LSRSFHPSSDSKYASMRLEVCKLGTNHG
jgi:hypothetical protein